MHVLFSSLNPHNYKVIQRSYTHKQPSSCHGPMPVLLPIRRDKKFSQDIYIHLYCKIYHVHIFILYFSNSLCVKLWIINKRYGFFVKHTKCIKRITLSHSLLPGFLEMLKLKKPRNECSGDRSCFSMLY